MKISSNTSLQQLFDIAKASVNEVDSGEKFIVKDLFRGFEWNRIGKGNRTKLGAMFFAYAKDQGTQYIDVLSKTPQNQQIYMKK